MDFQILEHYYQTVLSLIQRESTNRNKEESREAVVLSISNQTSVPAIPVKLYVSTSAESPPTTHEFQSQAAGYRLPYIPMEQVR